jgi:hypothetical protein
LIESSELYFSHIQDEKQVYKQKIRKRALGRVNMGNDF